MRIWAKSRERENREKETFVDHMTKRKGREYLRFVATFLGKERRSFIFGKSALFYWLWIVVNSQCFCKNYSNHCLLRGWNAWLSHGCKCRRKRVCNPFKQRRHVRVWSKWRHNFSLFWWTRTSSHRNWSQTRNLRDKQKRYHDYEGNILSLLKHGWAEEQKQREQRCFSSLTLVWFISYASFTYTCKS